ncbi:MAG: toll/interleukin-1 receptor domain-containing protein, partial [Actinobacteria bacterium]|nr:toll/interleukin-1 receptor domain-containing protein [Actinomycetota bacterium]
MTQAYDVFVSYSSADKPVVHALAQRLRDHGLRVWLDDWEIEYGDSIPSRIEDGLERSRVLVLCMSERAFGSDWSRLEGYTFRFRDPLNRERRFVPLRLDDAPAPGSLGQFRYIDWRVPSDAALDALVAACGGPVGEPEPVPESPAMRASRPLSL